MLICTSCGQGNPEGARFCNGCAAPLVEAPASRAQRKVVTVLFCDVAGSTALGESLDPEALRTLLARYFERMRKIVEYHGGLVEKFAGDAVMAVFGLPAVHEDDALRALRAAVEMRDALPELEIEGRIGINTGEVVTGTEERLATGDAVNVAARLEQAAQSGEILVGEATLRLARGAVEAEAVEPLALKGKREPVSAWRLVSVAAEAAARRLESPLVGRERELLALGRAWERVLAERRCELVTVVGAAGVGKSRLVAELLARVDAAVVRGRCLSYGEGITYWPVVEVLKQLESRLAGFELDPAVSRALGNLLTSEGAASTDEIAWAVRKLLEAVAAERPLVAVFDDTQWGEEAFLDLLEHVAYLALGAPILLLCMARTELLDRRPGWGGVLRLETLAPQEAERLIDARLGRHQLKPGVRQRIVAAAGGNPLFVEEMAAMLRESGNGTVAVPPTIQALLAARLDQLDPAERTVLERAAVEGEVFHRGAVQALTPGESRLTTRLTSLVRKELVRPDKAQLAGEDAYRFRHLLIRDAAYDALSKTARAELHERLTAWLEEHGRDLVELDEIIGYHLEQACRYRTELGPADERGRELALRAAGRLGTAGHRALLRADAPAAVNLLSRASSLLAADERAQLQLLPDLGDALQQAGELAKANAILVDVIESAKALREQSVELRAIVEQCALGISIEPGRRTIEQVRQTIEQAISELELLGDDRGLARAWRLLAEVQFDSSDERQTLQRALEHARRTGDEREQAEIMIGIGITMIFGRTPAVDAIRHIEQNLAWYRARGVRRAEAQALGGLAHLQAMRGHFEEARTLLTLHRAIVEDLGQRRVAAGFAWASGAVEKLAGDPSAAERELRAAYESMTEMGAKAPVSDFTAALADAEYAQGNYEEAERWADISAEAAATHASDSLTGWRAIRAKLLARTGDFDQAERLAREAIALAEQDDIDHHADLLTDLAEVLRLAARSGEAVPVVDQALQLYEQKGNIVSAGKARALLAELRETSSSSPVGASASLPDSRTSLS